MKGSDMSAETPNTSIPLQSLRWPFTRQLSSEMVDSTLEAVTKLWNDAGDAVLTLVAEQIARGYEYEAPAFAEFVRFSAVEDDESNGESYRPTGAWQSDGSEVDFDVLEDIENIEDELLTDRLADLLTLWPTEHFVVHLPTGAFFDGRTGKPAPWSHEKTESLPEVLRERIGVPEFEAMFENMLTGEH